MRFGLRPAVTAYAPSVPDDCRVYAVGDVHGRDDLLVEVRRLIVSDAKTAGDRARVVVYLGDYVDRGPGSFEVIDRLIHEPLPGFRQVFLKGNHEDLMLAFLSGPPDPVWLCNGGVATLESYGVGIDWFLQDTRSLEAARQQLQETMPQSHRQFLEDLRIRHVEGDYAFVHAGVRPGVPLASQDTRDLMWIRGPFLTSDANFGKRVVHGHTIVPEPEVRRNRIGIDTGAVRSGRLTCLVLQGTTVRFLQT